MEPKLVITIGRQYGSGGHAIGKLLAQKMNIAFYDKEMTMEILKNSDINEILFKSYDEKSVAAYSLDACAGENYYQTIAEKVYLAEFYTIRKLADEKPCVFVGRCADYVLKGSVDSINFFVHAPLKERIERICKRDGIDHREAEILIRKNDNEREKYYNYHTSQKWGYAGNYNMTIDTGKIGVEGAAGLMEQFLNIVNNKMMPERGK